MWAHVPLVALHRRGGPIRPLLGPAGIDGGMRQYTGSIAFDPSGALVGNDVAIEIDLSLVRQPDYLRVAEALGRPASD